MQPNFVEFDKIPRLTRLCVVSEKIDGTNACICVADDGETMFFGSRTRWITPEDDNFGFARWAAENRSELLKLGPGTHYGEWWGQGIQRRYGLQEKRFSLFNSARWGDASTRPACCHVVPVLFAGEFTTPTIDRIVDELRSNGSAASPGFMKPEGVVIWHEAARMMFKKTLEKDTEWKGKSQTA